MNRDRQAGLERPTPPHPQDIIAPPVDHGGMAERTNALVLKTSGGQTPVGSNPTLPAPRKDPMGGFVIILLKNIKIMKTFGFRLCTLRVSFLA